MKQLAMLVVTLALGFTLGAGDAEAAKRFGGGRTSGMQRQTAPTAAPTQSPSSPAAANATAKSQTGAPAAAAQKRSWMGPIGGLAAGLGLAALASHFGFGEELASMMMIGLLVMVVMVVIGLIMRRRAAAQSAPRGMQYAAAGVEPKATRHFDVAMPAAAGGASAGATSDFDRDAFLRNAKVLFIRLQAANDSANLADIREFTTPEMFAEVRMEIAERGELEQRTDVLTVDAELIELVAEEERQVASLHFNATLRQGGDGPVETVGEIWHLVLPKGRKAWCLAGIQQLQ